MAVNDGGPAFPSAAFVGMSLRDWFAGQALQAFMRLSYSAGGGFMQYEKHAEEAAKAAYSLADAMLKARQQ